MTAARSGATSVDLEGFTELRVTKDILVGSEDCKGFAAISWISQRFDTTAPEPAAMLLIGFALLTVHAARKHRARAPILSVVERARLGLAALCLLGVMLTPSLSAAAPMEISFRGVTTGMRSQIQGGSLMIGNEAPGDDRHRKDRPPGSPPWNLNRGTIRSQCSPSSCRSSIRSSRTT